MDKLLTRLWPLAAGEGEWSGASATAQNILEKAAIEENMVSLEGVKSVQAALSKRRTKMAGLNLQQRNSAHQERMQKSEFEEKVDMALRLAYLISEDTKSENATLKNKENSGTVVESNMQDTPKLQKKSNCNSLSTLLASVEPHDINDLPESIAPAKRFQKEIFEYPEYSTERPPLERKNRSDDDSEEPKSSNGFMSAREKLGTKSSFNNRRQSPPPQNGNGNEECGDGGYGSRPSLGSKRRRVFKPPGRLNPPDECRGAAGGANRPLLRRNNQSSAAPQTQGHGGFRADKAIKRALDQQNQNQPNGEHEEGGIPPEYLEEPRLRGLDPALIERIESEVLQQGDPITFDDIAGLRFAKENIEEIVVWPLKNPEYYTGLRQLPKGLLLFGPPGTGKTLIGKAIAHEVNATFFSISASSLTSKWIGEGEKTVRALFGVAAVKQPSVVFIDEVDSLLCQRTADENESSRRIKTEFLVQLDGAATSSQERVLVIGATNRPQELDEAARRRFIKRLYIPLPDEVTRVALLRKLLGKNEHDISEQEIKTLVDLTDGYSGADVTNLAREASMGPLRDKMRKKMEFDSTSGSKLRPITFHDFEIALRSIRASVSQDDLTAYIKWNDEFGTQEYSK